MALPLTGYERLVRHNLKKKDIREKANALVKEKIRRITKRDKVLYNSLFAYPVMREFSKQYGFTLNQVIILMLLDLYPTFIYKDAVLWGINKSMFWESAIILTDRGYMYSGGTRSRCFYPTLKGKEVVKEFNKYYDEHVKKLFRSLGERDHETIRKVTRVQPARIYKPRDQSTGGKPAPNSGGKGSKKPN
jgi:DNA-binding MarR family transcriptional regulator